MSWRRCRLGMTMSTRSSQTLLIPSYELSCCRRRSRRRLLPFGRPRSSPVVLMRRVFMFCVCCFMYGFVRVYMYLYW
jgi:hypothetical protein